MDYKKKLEEISARHFEIGVVCDNIHIGAGYHIISKSGLIKINVGVDKTSFGDWMISVRTYVNDEENPYITKYEIYYKDFVRNFEDIKYDELEKVLSNSIKNIKEFIYE